MENENLSLNDYEGFFFSSFRGKITERKTDFQNEFFKVLPKFSIIGFYSHYLTNGKTKREQKRIKDKLNTMVNNGELKETFREGKRHFYLKV